LDEGTRRILDQELSQFYTYLLPNLTGGSRAIITSRYPPADVPFVEAWAHLPVGDFPQAAFLKFLLRDPAVERRYQASDLAPDLLRDLHRLLGGTPRFLEQMREVLKTIPADELQAALRMVNPPDGAPANAVQEIRDHYFEQIFVDRLYSYLSPEAQQALSRAAVYGVPVSVDGLAAVAAITADQAQAFTRQWQEHALAYPEQERAASTLWTVYGLLRNWLLAPERLSDDERRAAHQAAGNFLRELEQQDREGELGLSWVDCLLEARSVPSGWRH
jgi:hypothetical protein